jgi:hypothetical protein
MKISSLLLVSSLGLAACSSAPGTGPLQPQAVNGTCQVKPFFLVGLSATPVTMTVDGNGQGCSFSVINPDLQAIQSAALITVPAGHGRAEAGLAYGGATAVIRYQPAPGYAGADRFTATIEPGDKALSVGVTITR